MRRIGEHGPFVAELQDYTQVRAIPSPQARD